MWDVLRFHHVDMVSTDQVLVVLMLKAWWIVLLLSPVVMECTDL